MLAKRKKKLKPPPGREGIDWNREERSYGVVYRDTRTHRILPGSTPPPKPEGYTVHSGPRLGTELRKILEEKFSDGKTRGHMVMRALVNAANRGDVAAIKEVMNRVDGRVPEEVKGEVKLEGQLSILSEIGIHAITEEYKEAFEKALGRKNS